MQQIGLNITGSSPFEVPNNRFAIVVVRKKAGTGNKIEAKTIIATATHFLSTTQ
jgi:hypothetical protein